MDQRGVVLEIEGDEAIVLTPSGEFRRQRISHPKPEIGDEIPLSSGKKNHVHTKGRWSSAPWHWMTTAVAAAVLLMVNLTGFGGLGSQPLQEPATDGEAGAVLLVTDQAPPQGLAVKFVTVDINPSIELALNEENRVIVSRPLNDDGKKLLQAETLDGLDAEEAVSRITNEAIQQGFLSPSRDNAVVIAVAGEDRPVEGKGSLESRLRDSTLRLLPQDTSSTKRVQVVRAPADAREKARQIGLSVGKYAVFLEALDRGLDVQAADLKKASITNVIAAAGGDPLDVLQGAAVEQDLAGKEARHQERLKEALQEEAESATTGVSVNLPPAPSLPGASQSAPIAAGAKTPEETAPSSEPAIEPPTETPVDSPIDPPANLPSEPPSAPPAELPVDPYNTHLPEVTAPEPGAPLSGPESSPGQTDQAHQAGMSGLPPEESTAPPPVPDDKPPEFSGVAGSRETHQQIKRKVM
ncbi:anti-sigma factor domain-containing protein [Heliobacterium undosum]|uniref:Anti-sigma factor domain-containing protein n=1 Tax=Heliomicrobium undosum TaxID=121734 RepID=A0A845LDF5_9FIRM|nr:anti-sigma factor domain-containing protein [Heliomicrobium undosum]MZP30951.1 anti-sigma factor domain-containing protein [Heliomicrobium undosum]